MMKNEDNQEGSGALAPLPASAASTRTSAVRSIVVNGRGHLHAGDEIGSRELARLAWPGEHDVRHDALTVAFEGGPVGAASGLLPMGASTPIVEGQSFSVSLTDKS